MILFFLKFIIFVVSIAFFGWQFLRRVIKQNELYLLIPFSLGFGIIIYTLFVNIISYFVDVRASFWLVLILLWIIGLILNKVKINKTILGIEKKTFKKLIFITIVFSFIFSAIIFNNYAYDEIWHGGLIATIANGNFPVMSTYIPNLYSQYHYGFDLFAASIKSFLGLPLQQSSDLAMILIFVPIFWSVFVAIKKITTNNLAAWLSAWLLFFGGGFRYLSVVESIDQSKVKYFWDYANQILSVFLNSKPMSPGLFHSYSTDSMGVLIYHRPTLYASLIIILIFWLIYLEQKRKNLLVQISLGVLFGFFALSAESWFVLLILSWGIWKGLILLKNKQHRKKIIYSMVTVGVIASFMAIFQGGVITDILLHTSKGMTTTSMSTFVIRDVPGLISYGDIYPFNEIKSWAFFVLEWGLILLFFPFVSIYVYKSKNKILQLMLLAIVVTLLIVFWVDYPVSSRDLVRINVFAYLLMSLLLGIYLSEKFKNKTKVITTILIIVSVSPLMYNIRIMPASWHWKNVQSNYDDKQNELIVAKEVREQLSEPGAVLTAIPYFVVQSWGRQVYWGNPEEDIVFNRKIAGNLPKLLREKTIKDIAKKGVAYVYANPEFKKYAGRAFIDKNKSFLEEIYNKDNKYIVYKIK